MQLYNTKGNKRAKLFQDEVGANAILTTDKPDIDACLLMTSPTSRNLTPGLTVHQNGKFKWHVSFAGMVFSKILQEFQSEENYISSSKI